MEVPHAHREPPFRRLFRTLLGRPVAVSLFAGGLSGEPGIILPAAFTRRLYNYWRSQAEGREFDSRLPPRFPHL